MRRAGIHSPVPAAALALLFLAGPAAATPRRVRPVDGEGGARRPCAQAPGTKLELKDLPKDLLVEIMGFATLGERANWAGTAGAMQAMAFEDVRKVDARGVSDPMALLGFLQKHRDTITDLDLSGLDFVDAAWGPLIGAMGGLEALALSACPRVSDPLLASLPAGLERLDLSGCANLTDAGLGHLRGMHLKALDLGRCRITPAGFAHLAGMPLEQLGLPPVPADPGVGARALALLPADALRVLTLDCDHVDGNDQRPIDEHLDALLPRAVRLERLRLMLGGACAITGRTLEHLRGKPVRSLEIQSIGLKPAWLAHLRLQSLTLHWADLDPAGLGPLEAMPLRELALVGCHGLSNGNLGPHLARMGSLGSLKLINVDGADGRPEVTGELLQHLPRQLTELEFCHCRDLADRDLAGLKGMRLRRLELAAQDERALTFAGLAHLQGMPLESLAGHFGPGEDGRGLRHLRGLPLTELCLFALDDPDDEDLGHLQALPSLRKLQLQICPAISDQGLERLGKLPTLRNLHLTGNKEVSAPGVAALGRLWRTENLTLVLEHCAKVPGPAGGARTFQFRAPDCKPAGGASTPF